MEYTHYLNGSYVLEEKVVISGFELGVLRGYGVFDYVQLYNGRPFHLMDHLKRLKWSADRMKISLPLSLEEYYQDALTLIKKNPPINAGLRFVVTGGLSSGDFLIPETPPSVMILFHPFTPHPKRYYTEGMRASTTQMLRLLSNVKSTNYAPAIFAMKEAKSSGFDDALYLTADNEILEATTANAFFFKEDTLITAESDIVHGVTRSIILELVKDLFPIEYRPVRLEEVESCSEAFLTSSVKDVVPLVQIDDHKVGFALPGPRTTHIRDLFNKYVENYISHEVNIKL